MTRQRLAEWATMVGRQSSNPGAPDVWADSPEKIVAAWLTWYGAPIDPDYPDESAWARLAVEYQDR